MTDILTVTLNPALDVATSTPEVVAGPKLRCTDPVSDPGGGGINVARAVRFLGGAATAWVAVGGPTGAALLGLLEAEGVPVIPFDVPGDTRQSLTVTDAAGRQFRFVLPGPSWPPPLWRQAQAAIGRMARGIVVLSGSLPPGLPDDVPQRLAAGLRPSRARLIVDTSGPCLAALAMHPAAGIAVLRMDLEEAEALARGSLATARDVANFADSLVRRAIADTVVISRGKDGAVLVRDDLRLTATMAEVPVVSKVGAGDSFVAAFALALARELSWAEALAHGNAAASAAVMTPATDLCRREDAESLLPQCVATAI